jgi:hypothetical protein
MSVNLDYEPLFQAAVQELEAKYAWYGNLHYFTESHLTLGSSLHYALYLDQQKIQAYQDKKWSNPCCGGCHGLPCISKQHNSLSATIRPMRVIGSDNCLAIFATSSR